jgi:glycosyltransferase involved in cell wall biosynthesis
VAAHTGAVAKREAYELAPAEALSRGVLVVAPPDGGGPEIVTDGVDGLIVDPTRPEALAEALLGLVRDPARRSEMGRRGRRLAVERFDVRRTSADVWDVVGGVARAGRGGGASK